MNLTEALNLAEDAHAGQVYGNQSYMDGHIYPVVACAIYDNFDRPGIQDVAVAAALHDTVEDTYVTLLGLQEMGASVAVVRGVDAVTRRPGEEYMAMIARARADRVGRVVKLADNWCNLQASIASGDERRVKRYEKARALLLTPA